MARLSRITGLTHICLLLPALLVLGVGCESGTSTFPSLDAIDPPAHSLRIQPHPDHSWYWMYDGEPILLIGGSNQDNLFNHPDLPPHGLEAHLDLLVAVGGNYVRNTMSSRDGGNLWPFRPIGNGSYDLDDWDDRYWQRLEDLLSMARERGVIVQIEVWDRFDFARDPWDANPFNPVNNVNYTDDQTGLPTSISTHPGRRENPFFRSTPAQEGNSVLLQYQERYVRKLLAASLPFPNVIYSVSNETNEAAEWSTYWADFMRDYAAETGYSIQVTEMWDSRNLADSVHDHTFDDPVRYTFLEVSQNNHMVGELHWRRAQDRRESIAAHPRPMTNVKIYGGPTHGGSFEEGARKFWRNIFGGLASARFHRPEGAGIGLNQLAQSHLRSMRLLVDEMNVFTAEPGNTLLSDREEDEAYVMATIGREYAVYFTNGGSVSLDVTDASGRLTLRWLDIGRSQWGSPAVVEGGDAVSLQAPGPGPWVALLTHEGEG